MFYLQMNTTLVETKLKNFNEQQIKNYTEYWKSITPPTDPGEIFKRWTYAICSVRMPVDGSTSIYTRLVRSFDDWKDDLPRLIETIKGAGRGMYNVKGEIIYNFTYKYILNPGDFLKKNDETWPACRDRIAAEIHGLGDAKTSFGLEMIYPAECQVVCNDCHQYKFYSTKNKGPNHYRKLENHFLKKSKEIGVPPAIARQILFDEALGYDDSKYWGFVFEGDFNKIKLELTSTRVEQTIAKLKTKIDEALDEKIIIT